MFIAYHCLTFINRSPTFKNSEKENFIYYFRPPSGEMTLFRTESDGRVLFMEVDLVNNSHLIYADISHVLKITYGKGYTSAVLVGNPGQSGYKEGSITEAIFNGISSFTQLNDSVIVIVDRGNHCLRRFDRIRDQTDPFVGSCTIYGYQNGINALFSYPTTVLKDPRTTDSLLVSDTINNAIRMVTINNQSVSNVFESRTELKFPAGLAFDNAKTSLYITSRTYISKYDLQFGNISRITGGDISGYLDGSLTTAVYSTPGHLMVIDELVVIVDGENNVLRVIDEKNGMVTTICRFGNGRVVVGNVSDCELMNPSSIYLNDTRLYIGESGGIRVLHLGNCSNIHCGFNRILSLNKDYKIIKWLFK